MHKSFLIAGILSAALAVAFGAFGAHGLKKMVDTETLDVFKTGVQYQFYHALALIITSLLAEKISAKEIKWAGNLFITGIILFSGSLYAITLFKAWDSGVPGWIGPVTPAGGALFITGWIFLLIAAIKHRQAAG